LPNWQVGVSVRVVNESAPTPREAQAAINEAMSQAATLGRSDDPLRRIVIGIAACYLVAGVVVSLSPSRNSPVLWPAVLLIVIGFCVGVTMVGLRIRALSRRGQALYIWGVMAFNAWMGIVAGVSIGTRWWASTQPSYHFGISIAVAVTPLIFLAWLLGRRS
jgi:hypothetical protein